METIYAPRWKTKNIKKNIKEEDLFFGQKETGAERVSMATTRRASFCFFCDGQLWSRKILRLLTSHEKYTIS